MEFGRDSGYPVVKPWCQGKPSRHLAALGNASPSTDHLRQGELGGSVFRHRNPPPHPVLLEINNSLLSLA
jgi:hypothetical protein